MKNEVAVAALAAHAAAECVFLNESSILRSSDFKASNPSPDNGVDEERANTGVSTAGSAVMVSNTGSAQ